MVLYNMTDSMGGLALVTKHIIYSEQLSKKTNVVLY